MNKAKETIKMGGCYKTEEGWLIVGVKRNGYYQCRDIIIDDGGYDEEISDLSEDRIREIADLSVCFRAYYHKAFGLYKVWDESRPRSEAIVLQSL